MAVAAELMEWGLSLKGSIISKGGLVSYAVKREEKKREKASGRTEWCIGITRRRPSSSNDRSRRLESSVWTPASTGRPPHCVADGETHTKNIQKSCNGG